MTDNEGYVGPITEWTRLQPAPMTPVGRPEAWVDQVHDHCHEGE